jgi:uncharacterized protein
MPGFLARPGRKAVLGVIHLAPLPGTPFYEPGSLPQAIDTAVASARALEAGGADGCLVQTADRVYSVADESDPARTAAMALIVQAVVRATGDDFETGVQLMRNAVKASLAVAKIAGGSFIRAGALVGATMSTHGIVAPDPADVMAYRRSVDAWDVQVVADIDSMHFSWLGGGKPTAEVARAALGVGADAVCLGHPDESRTLDLIRSVRAVLPDARLILAGHTDHANAARLLAGADGVFVAGCLTAGGWGGPIEVDLVSSYVDAVRAAS